MSRRPVLDGWGKEVAGDEFSNAGAPDPRKWLVYNGPGHAGKWIRRPKALTIASPTGKPTKASWMQIDWVRVYGDTDRYLIGPEVTGWDKPTIT